MQLRLLITATVALLGSAAPAAGPVSINAQMTGDLRPVHDPSVIQAGNYFYVYSTSQLGEAPGLIHIRRSPDLIHWTKIGAVFAQIPDWAKNKIAGTKGIWAPDISKHGDQYRLYYSVSTFGSNTSAIGLATSPTLDPEDPGYRWADQGLVFASDVHSDFNAIDPNIITTPDGAQYMTFGSFWSGLKLIELDPVSGKPKPGAQPVALAQRAAPDAIEAPVIIRRGQYYYLFAAFDFCCRGANSTYYTVVGRSANVAGPYVDSRGRKMLNGYGEVLLHAKLDKTKAFVGPGGASVATSGDRAIIVYHAYDKRNGGTPTLRIQPLGWNSQGWPVAL